MNKATLESQWLQIREILKEKFNHLTEEDIKEINGRYDQLVTKLQQKYGYSREEAEERIMSLNFDRNVRLAKGSTVGEEKTYEKASVQEDSSSFLKWLFALGIPLLLLGAYLLSPFGAPQTTNIPNVIREEVIIETPTDQTITNELRIMLLSSNNINMQNVQITTHDGIVTLTGTVSSKEDSDFIEDIVDDYPGVRDVINKLRVK
jgi:uncharacterized protein YjbJ (UPF0337 family)